mmetsp:Transcript_46894/g.87380  ORF Transcript_46894/g.87380 Transcript_46894/m.87380 type:complete len:378 (+) Transcript_46894:179-1312(+)
MDEDHKLLSSLPTQPSLTLICNVPLHCFWFNTIQPRERFVHELLLEFASEVLAKLIARALDVVRVLGRRTCLCPFVAVDHLLKFVVCALERIQLLLALGLLFGDEIIALLGKVVVPHLDVLFAWWIVTLFQSTLLSDHSLLLLLQRLVLSARRRRRRLPQGGPVLGRGVLQPGVSLAGVAGDVAEVGGVRCAHRHSIPGKWGESCGFCVAVLGRHRGYVGQHTFLRERVRTHIQRLRTLRDRGVRLGSPARGRRCGLRARQGKSFGGRRPSHCLLRDEPLLFLLELHRQLDGLLQLSALVIQNHGCGILHGLLHHARQLVVHLHLRALVPFRHRHAGTLKLKLLPRHAQHLSQDFVHLLLLLRPRGCWGCSCWFFLL